MPSNAPPEIDLSDTTLDEFRTRLGTLVQVSLQRSGACVLISRGAREISIIDPVILDSVPEEDMAIALLDTWGEDEILSYLAERATRRAAAGVSHVSA